MGVLGCGWVYGPVNRDIIIGTTKLISGTTLLETLLSDPIRPEVEDKDDL